jgi:hypothetical protein
MTQVKIGLTDRQLKSLRKESAMLGISLAELLRRILDQHIDRRKEKQS